MRSSRFAAAALLLALLATACSDGTPTSPKPAPPPPPPRQPAVRITVSPDTATIQAGDSLFVSVLITDSLGLPLSASPTWTISPANLAAFERGRIHAYEEGEVRAVVQVLGVADTVSLRITPAPAMTLELSRELHARGWAYIVVRQGRIIRGQTTYSISSSNPTVVDALPDGRVVAHGEGEATITVMRSFLGGTRADTATLSLVVGPRPAWMGTFTVEYAPNYTPTPAEDRIIRRAVIRWQNVIEAPLQPTVVVTLPPNFGACNMTNAPRTIGVEGFRVFIRVLPDSLAAPGVGAYGGWCHSDTDGYQRLLAVDIVQRFLTDVRAGGHPPEYFEAVMMHEIAHGLGVVHLMGHGRPSHRIEVDGGFGFTGLYTLAAYRELMNQPAAMYVPLSPDGHHFASAMNTDAVREVIAGGGRISPLSLGVIADQGSPVRFERAEGPQVRLPGASAPSIWYLRAAEATATFSADADPTFNVYVGMQRSP